MSDNTHIEWTDATWNPITGCSVVSAGCKHCYAMKLAGTRLKHEPSRAGLTIDTKAGPVWTGEVRFNEKWIDQPLRWRRPRRIFVCAHGDLFHESVPDEWIDIVFTVMALAPQHTFQVLTKRADRMRKYMLDDSQQRRDSRLAAVLALDSSQPVESEPWQLPAPNVWLGVSVEDQAAADERIPLLLQCPAAVRWISAEPLLGPVDLTDLDAGAVGEETIPREDWCDVDDDESPPALAVNALTGLRWQRFGDWQEDGASVDWVVAGGESGTGARPMHPDWARSLRDQCASAGVPFLFKQWGAWAPRIPGAHADGSTNLPAINMFPDGYVAENGDDFRARPKSSGNHSQVMWRTGKKAAGRLLDGVQHDGYPEARHA